MKIKSKIARFLTPKNEMLSEDKQTEFIKKSVDTISLNPTISEINSFFGVNDITTAGPALYSATYYACMLIRCNAFAKLPFKIMRTTPGGGAEPYREHPLYELLTLRPNPYMSAHDFKWATKFMTLHYGNGYWAYTFEHGRITGVYLLDSASVQILVDDAGLVGKQNAIYYYYYDKTGRLFIYPSEKIVHFKCFSTDGIQGYSIRHFLASDINKEQLGDGVITSKYKNGLQDPLIVQYSGDLNNQMIVNKIKRKFSEIGGVQNAGKVIPIPAGFSANQLATRLVDSQFFELQGLTTRKIANAFGVKGFQLNDMEKSTYSNVEQQNKAFYSDTLQNDLIAAEQEVDYKLLFPFERKQGVFSQFNADAMLRSDTLSRYQAYQIGISSSFIMPSEVRAKENMPFIEGSDQLIHDNGAAVPLSDIGIQYK